MQHPDIPGRNLAQSSQKLTDRTISLFIHLHLNTYLKHDHTDLLHTLNYRLGSASDGDGSLCGVGEHVSCHLYLSTCWLEHKTEKNETRIQDQLHIWCTKFQS